MMNFSFSVFFILGIFLVPLFAQVEETKPTETVVKVTDVASDETIANRLNGIFKQVKELQEVSSEVNSGVARLSGIVPDERSRQDALALARRTDGVIFTVDRIRVAAEVEAQLTPAINKLKSLRTALITKLPLIGIAILVIGIATWFANFLHRQVKWFEKLNVSSLARVLLRRITRIVLIGIGFVIALEILDATAVVGAILGAAGLAGLALGFAFRNIAENYLGGILLSARNPFEIGDAIEVNGKIGKVAMLSARDTVLITMDGNHLRIPNSVVMNSELLNYTRNPKRRFEFRVGVSVDLELNEARHVGLRAMKKCQGVLADPKPSVIVDSLGDSAVVLLFHGWVDQQESDFLKTRSETIRIVKEAYDEAGIEMPEPIYRVHLRGDSTIAGNAGIEKSIEKSTPREKSKADTKHDSELDDISPDRHIGEQIEEERKNSEEENLLDEKH